MSKHWGWRTRPAARNNCTNKSGGLLKRRLGFESLEERRLLTVVTPTSVTFEPQTGQGTAALTTANNSSTATELSFLVAGVTPGDTVYIFADGNTTPLANSSAPVATGASTITVTTGGTDTISDGSHTFTAEETDTSNRVSAPSPASAPVQIFDDLTLTQTAATATAGSAFAFTAATNVPNSDTATITAGSTLLPGMSFNATTNTFSGWTPASTDAGTTQVFTVNLTDTLGNSTTVSVFVAVTAPNTLTVSAPPATIAVGSPVLVAFSTTNSGTPNFTVTATSNGSPATTDLTATIMPASNQYLEINTSLGPMVFQLFNNLTPETVTHFVNLVNSGTYNTNADFYRIIQTFVDQGGVGGTGSTIPVELNPLLRFTSSGLLAMANNGVDGNSSEFYITNPDDMSNGFLDFRYSIFGKLVSGDNVRQAIAEAQVGPNSSGEDSAPFATPQILSMSVTTGTDDGVVLLKAPAGASGSYTVTVSDGLGGSQNFTINVGTNSFDQPNPWVAPVTVGANSAGANSGDQIYTAANTPATFTPQGISADNSAVQVSAQLFVPLVGSSFSSDLVDNSYTGTNPAADAANPDMTLMQSGSSYTVTPDKGDYGVQVLEITGYTPVSGTFELQVGSTTTAAITFDSTNLAATAADIQSALQSAGFSGATVKVTSSNTAPAFNFDVTFASAESPIAYQAAATALPVAFANSATAAAAQQELTFTDTGNSWDSGAGVDPVYRAFVPVYVAPPTPAIASITAGGMTVSGNTLDNNSTTASELAFNITGAASGATVSVFLDGGATPIATGTVASNSTTIKLTTNGTTMIADGSHSFTVVQTIATAAYSLLADWTASASGLSPGAQFQIPASSLSSPVSAGTSVTVGLTVLAPPTTSVQVGVLYTYVVQTNAPSGDTVTVTPVALPAGMVFTAPNTFTWTPSNAQLNTSPAFSATISDSLGNTGTIGPVNISVIIGLAPVQVPVNTALGGNLTVTFSGNKVQVYNNITKAILTTGTFRSTDTIEIDAPAGQANTVTVMVPGSSTAPLPQKVFVNGASGATNDSVIVYGTSGVNNFGINGATATDNGLATQIANIQKLTLTSPGGNSYYTLTNSVAATTVVVAMGTNNTLDFSHDTAGVDVNLGLDTGQPQYITPWGNNLSIVGAISFLTGSEYSNILTGGHAATTFIRSGASNSTVIGGTGNNVLIGGGGNDTIIGGAGKNLIIAGNGTDTIYANGRQNMVFGGTLNYDSNDSALLNLLAQGSFASFGSSYRRALASAARNPALSANLLKFQDSGAADVIFGSNFNVNNWFVLGKHDTVRG